MNRIGGPLDRLVGKGVFAGGSKTLFTHPGGAPAIDVSSHVCRNG